MPPARWRACRRRSAQASRLVETARRDPLGMSLTWLTISRPSPAPSQLRQQVARAAARAFDTRRHEARRDHRRLEQPEIVAAEIEHLRQIADFGAGFQIDADQPDHGAVDHAQIRFDGRLRRLARPIRGRRDQWTRSGRAPLGIIHAEEEDVAPAAVGQVHAHRRGFVQNRERTAAGALRAVPDECAADSRPDGRCGTSTDCRAPSARCAAPDRPESGTRGRDRPRPARWTAPSLGPIGDSRAARKDAMASS